MTNVKAKLTIVLTAVPAVRVSRGCTSVGTSQPSGPLQERQEGAWQGVE
jgi:hypothetical protein